MPEWTCGRCTFINHDLMNNCEMCEAPREAAEIPYLGEQNPQSGRPESSDASSFERPSEPMEQTTHVPSADDMLNGMETETPPVTAPVSTSNETQMEANVSLPPQESSLTEVMPAAPECSKLPEPLAPVVLHSLETQQQLESPISEPEQIDEAMCMPSPAKSAEDNGWSFLDNEVRMVMIGKTGVGKSTTGNNILGSKSFKSSASGASVTKKCQLGWASRFNRDIQIIDTPGLFDTGMSNEDISREIVKCIGMTSPGPHAFILVIRLDRFTAEEKATVDHFINIFGKDMLKYLVVLFTRMDDLKHDGTTLDEYVQNVPPDLEKLLKDCQHRRIGFDNRGTQEEKDQDVQDLLKLVDGMVTGNGGGHYTNEMFEEAERIIAEQEEEHLKQSREKMKQEMARLREEVEEEMRRKEEEKRKELEQMKGKLSELGIHEEDDEWVQVFATSDMSPGEEMVSITPSSSEGACAPKEPAKSETSTLVNGTSTATLKAEEKPIAPQRSSLEEGKGDTTGRKSADDYFRAGDVPPNQFNDDVGSCSSRQAEQGSMYATDSYTGPQQPPTNRSFVSNESLPREGKSIHQREVEELRERKAKLEAKHQMDKERMRADYMARQSQALHEYNKRHQESRQRYRQEMHNTSSNIFTRMFGAMKNFFKSTGSSISRGFQSLFMGVHGRSTSCHGHAF